MPKKFPLISKNFHPFGDLIGLEFIKLAKGYSQCTLEVNDKLMNPHKVIHGGVLYSMADTGMGGALYTYLDKNELCATLDIKITYFRGVRLGTLICDTKVIHKGKRVAFLESEILNDERLVAKAVGTYSIFKVDNK